MLKQEIAHKTKADAAHYLHGMSIHDDT